uniref:PDZ domain-containing protein n=1 Tax=Myripristis murdjan TaxID=586833 RepID=A0A667XWC3_9TELE
MLQRYGSLSGKLHMIELEKDPEAHGLGLSLTGNRDGSRARMSIFVSDIIRGGGAAIEDGRLKSGDQIIAVNGHCLEGVTHAEAKYVTNSYVGNAFHYVLVISCVSRINQIVQTFVSFSSVQMLLLLSVVLQIYN